MTLLSRSRNATEFHKTYFRFHCFQGVLVFPSFILGFTHSISAPSPQIRSNLRSSRCVLPLGNSQSASQFCPNHNHNHNHRQIQNQNYYPLRFFKKSSTITTNMSLSSAGKAQLGAGAPTPDSALVSVHWLNDQLNAKRNGAAEGSSVYDLYIIDATWYLPNAGITGHQDFLKEHIPTARFFDIDADKFKDDACPYPHNIPATPEGLAEFARGLRDDFGIGVEKTAGAQKQSPKKKLIVVYDKNMFVASARVWWTFRALGIPDSEVKVLDGGFFAWKLNKFPTVSTDTNLEIYPIQNINDRIAPFELRHVPELIRYMDQVLENIKTRKELVLDARSRGRFDGTAPEPRPGLQGGHVPFSCSTPSTDFVKIEPDQDRTLVDGAQIIALVRKGLVDATEERNESTDLWKEKDWKEISSQNTWVTACGTGVTASVVALALYQVGVKNAAVYDGSWSEYGLLGLNNPVKRK